MTALPDKTYHVKFTQSKEIYRYRWPPESFVKKLMRKLKATIRIKPKGRPFVKLHGDKP